MIHRKTPTLLVGLLASIGLLFALGACGSDDPVEVGIAEDGPGPEAPVETIAEPEQAADSATDGGEDAELALDGGDSATGNADTPEDGIELPDDFELNIGGSSDGEADGTADEQTSDDAATAGPPAITEAPDAPSTAPPGGGEVGVVDHTIHRWTYIGVLGNLGPNEQVVPPIADPPQANPGTAPLTGLPITEDLDRNAVIVKIDNSPLARPQVSINEADVVYEELVESGITRFAAVYHSTAQPLIGPVRSGRSTDISIVGSYNTPLFAFSGANSIFEVLINNAQIQNRSHELWGGFWRDNNRPAPHNLFTNTQTVWDSHTGAGGAPAPHFAFRAEGEPATGGEPATEIRLEYLAGKSPTINYQWDPSQGGWLRWQAGTPHYDGAGVQAAPNNVIVQYINYIDSGLTDKWGEDLYEGLAVGTGGALVFTDGQVIQATWTRSTLAGVTTYTDKNGDHIALTPGNTWIALVPPGGANYE